MGWKGDRMFRASHSGKARGRALGAANLKTSEVKELPETNLLAEVDWRSKGAVHEPPQVQGNCGSCWAFTAVGALEAAHFVRTGELLNLSVQQLIDCNTGGQYGCDGGFIDYAYEYSRNTPVVEAKHYPYTEKAGRCRVKGDKLRKAKLEQDMNEIKSVSASEHFQIKPKNAGQLKAAL